MQGIRGIFSDKFSNLKTAGHGSEAIWSLLYWHSDCITCLKKGETMPNLSKITKDHDVIRSWAEARGATPSHVKSTESAEDVGVLRLDFPGYTGQGTLETVTWEQFFEKFDQGDLAFVYEEETAAGQKSNFNKIVSSEGATARPSRGRGTGKKAARSSAKRRTARAAKTTRTTPARKGAKKISRPAAKTRVAKKAATKRAASRSSSSRSTRKKTVLKKTAGKKSRGRHR